MPLYDTQCTADACQAVVEVYLLLAERDAPPLCRVCGASTQRVLLPGRSTITVDPVIVYRAPDGTFRFPGDAQATMAGRYHAEGFERIEIRGAADMRRFESHMNQRERAIMSRRVDARQRMREVRESEMRSELRGRMQSMSRAGRDLARAVMTHNDHKPREQSSDPHFHNEVYSFDRSNREASRDNRGKRLRD